MPQDRFTTLPKDRLPAFAEDRLLTSSLTEAKRAARAQALERRKGLHHAGVGCARRAAGHALAVISLLREVRTVAGYLPLRSEIDPRPTMLALIGLGYRIGAPVVVASDAPLRFREWTPRARLERGAFGVSHPVEGDWIEPDAILAPLLAFDAEGWRLGYGGGFYDRTFAALRARRGVAALGLAFAGQQVATVPHGPEDERLDAVVTARGIVRPGA